MLQIQYIHHILFPCSCHFVLFNKVLFTGDGESVVKVRKSKLVCDCGSSLGICVHLMAVIRERGTSSFKAFVKSVTSSPPTLASSITLPKHSGQKPGEGSSKRQGGRTPKATPHQSASVAQNGYLVVRKTGRILVCHGCKKSLSGCTYVIQHHCSVPYPANTPDGKRVQVAGRAANHYFHLTSACISMSPSHSEFDRHVTIAAAVQAPYLKHQLKDLGFIVDI